jgi:hypothetical protein
MPQTYTHCTSGSQTFWYRDWLQYQIPNVSPAAATFPENSCTESDLSQLQMDTDVLLGSEVLKHCLLGYPLKVNRRFGGTSLTSLCLPPAFTLCLARLILVVAAACSSETSVWLSADYMTSCRYIPEDSTLINFILNNSGKFSEAKESFDV